ncbi:START domain-containing protein [Chitinophaga sp. YR573]|uniref:START domain-containing protein n=1 Tax=Chitinophaga sp. YR573 TaxID=1881040 RepID=UPI0008B85347|nr:START domain-containing protein [Chitinophaga sp. YR573]SEW28829.1 START domain-containing protein [Chitinophaga sp. YR573]
MHKILITVFLLAVNTASAQIKWHLNSEKDDMKIYTGTVPDSKIKAVKVECVFHATLSQLAAVLLDVNTAAEWLYHTRSASLVKQVSPSEIYYYSEISLPWPAQNRDFVAHLTITQNPVTKVMTIDGPSVKGFVPVKSGIVRVNNSKGYWVVTPLANSQIRVEYSLHVDPGGSLPAWLVNMFATEGPFKMFKNLRSQLENPAYKNAQLPFIVN